MATEQGVHTGRKSRNWLWVGAAFWASSIFATSCGLVTTTQLSHAVSAVAGGHVSESGVLKFWGVFWWIFVKGWHATEFGILFTLIRKAIPSIAWSAGLAIAYAFADEFHQLFVPYRGCRLSDVCIDTLGVIGAFALGEWFKFRRGQDYSTQLTAIFSRKWLVPFAALAWIALVFTLSIVPFGLVTLDRSTATSFPRP